MDGKQTDEPSWQFKPGETISPRAAAPVQDQNPPVQPAAPAAIVSSDPIATPEPTSVTADPVVQPTAALPPPASDSPPVPEAFAPDQPGPVNMDSPPTQEGDYIAWTASEYIAHEKTAGWHVGLVVVAVVIAAVSWFITKDILTAVVIVVAGVALSLYGARRPNELQYQLDNQGLSIGQKHYGYSDFRAFSIVPEGQFASIALIPSRRFMPMTTLYFDPNDGDKIIDILGMHLPHQERKADAVDSLMRKIRF